jgi:DNA helicase-2/ATP-dependent DNA helicase PcrA
VYGFRGSTASIFLREPGEEEVLPQSYRIPRAVHRLAQRIIAPVRERKPKVFKPRDAEGRVGVLAGVSVADVALARAEKGSKVLLLARTNRRVKEMAAELDAAGVPYGSLRTNTAWAIPKRGSRWAPTKFHLALDAVLKLRKASAISHDEALAVLAMTPSRGTLKRGVKTDIKRRNREPYEADVVRSWFEDGGARPERHFLTEALGPMERYLSRGRILPSGRVLTGTLHASKGLEGDTVILDTRLTRTIREECGRGAGGWDDERRVWYVGVTRAREELLLVPSDDMGLLMGEIS